MAGSFQDGVLDGISIVRTMIYEDARGSLAELFREDELAPYLSLLAGPREFCRMGYVSRSHRGKIRGPHEHVAQTDVFVIFCSAVTFFLWDARPASKTQGVRQKIPAGPNECTRLIIPPGVVHAYRAEQDAALVLNFPTALYKGWQRRQPVDEIRHEDDPESPYQLW